MIETNDKVYAFSFLRVKIISEVRKGEISFHFISYNLDSSYLDCQFLEFLFYLLIEIGIWSQIQVGQLDTK